MRARRGATIVESALVMAVFLLLLFGVFEYCRFLLVLHVTSNAARDGARYASVNVDKPASFVATDYTDAAGKVFPSVSRYTRERMGGIQGNVTGFRIGVYAADPDGLALDPQIIRPRTRSTASPKVYPDPFDPADPLAYPWNSVPFPERLAVTIDGEYRPALPTFLLMPSVIKVNVTAVTSGEG